MLRAAGPNAVSGRASRSEKQIPFGSQLLRFRLLGDTDPSQNRLHGERGSGKPWASSGGPWESFGRVWGSSGTDLRDSIYQSKLPINRTKRPLCYAKSDMSFDAPRSLYFCFGGGLHHPSLLSPYGGFTYRKRVIISLYIQTASAWETFPSVYFFTHTRI